MIIKLKEGLPIEIVKNTIENMSDAIIHIVTERNIHPEDSFTVLLNDFALEKKTNTSYIILPKHLKKGQNTLGVVWKQSTGQVVTFQREVDIDLYISIGGVPIERLPQVILDLSNKINALQKRIKKLEEEGTVI